MACLKEYISDQNAWLVAIPSTPVVMTLYHNIDYVVFIIENSCKSLTPNSDSAFLE